MQEVDKNNDNQISFDEFTDAMTVLVKRRLSSKVKWEEMIKQHLRYLTVDSRLLI